MCVCESVGTGSAGHGTAAGWCQAQLQYLERDCERCQHQCQHGAAVGGAEAPEQHRHEQCSLYSSYSSYSSYNYSYSYSSYNMILMQDRVLGETVSRVNSYRSYSERSVRCG